MGLSCKSYIALDWLLIYRIVALQECGYFYTHRLSYSKKFKLTIGFEPTTR